MLLGAPRRTKWGVYGYVSPKMHRFGGSMRLVVTADHNSLGDKATQDEAKACESITAAAYNHYARTDAEFDWAKICTEALSEAGLKNTHEVGVFDMTKMPFQLEDMAKIIGKNGRRRGPLGKAIFASGERPWSKPADDNMTDSQMEIEMSDPTPGTTMLDADPGYPIWRDRTCPSKRAGGRARRRRRRRAPRR
jgi:hypothetical protein